jgi:hypothetical protein
MEGLTELDLQHTKLESVGAAALAVGLGECVALVKLTISGEDGGETGYIKQAACSGSSFEVGAIVQYEGRPCRVTTGVSIDSLRVRACGAVVTMEVGMTELDLSGTGLGAAGAAVVAGFLPRCTVRGLQGSETRFATPAARSGTVAQSEGTRVGEGRYVRVCA